MRKLLLILTPLAALATTGLAQTPSTSTSTSTSKSTSPTASTSTTTITIQPEVPMVPAARPALGAASRSFRHELLARERHELLEEKAEDLADAQQKGKAERRTFRRLDR